MGSSGSKAARQTAGAAARKYPSRPSPTSNPGPTTNAPSSRPPPAENHRAGPTVRPQAHATGVRDEAINLDASDPDFARSLRQLGAVQPNPTMSPSSAFAHPQNPNNPSAPATSRSTAPIAPDPRTNPALMVLEARSKLQDKADREFLEAGRSGSSGREFLDVGTIRQILSFRDERGMPARDIERRLGLKSGVVQRLGGSGVFGITSGSGERERGEIEMV